MIQSTHLDSSIQLRCQSSSEIGYHLSVNKSPKRFRSKRVFRSANLMWAKDLSETNVTVRLDTPWRLVRSNVVLRLTEVQYFHILWQSCRCQNTVNKWVLQDSSMSCHKPLSCIFSLRLQEPGSWLLSVSSRWANDCSAAHDNTFNTWTHLHTLL